MKEMLDKESLINNIYKLPLDLESMAIVREWIRDFTPYMRIELEDDIFKNIYNKLP